jgi:hypothetical protein
MHQDVWHVAFGNASHRDADWLHLVQVDFRVKVQQGQVVVFEGRLELGVIQTLGRRVDSGDGDVTLGYLSDWHGASDPR